MFDYFKKLNKHLIDQIKYRESIVTGEIIEDNGDGTYDVEITQSNKAYPNVETAFYDESFAVGEIVFIIFEHGSREMPRIWKHAKKVAQAPIGVEEEASGEGGNPITTVETLDAYSIATITAYLEGKIILSGGAGNCTRRGFEYGATIGYGEDIHEDGDYGEGYFNKQITG